MWGCPEGSQAVIVLYCGVINYPAPASDIADIWSVWCSEDLAETLSITIEEIDDAFLD